MNKQTYDSIKAISHPSRIAIIKLIKENNGNLCFDDIMQQLKLAKMTANFHINKLKSAKLIVTKKQKQKFLVTLNSCAIDNLKKTIQSL